MLLVPHESSVRGEEGEEEYLMGWGENLGGNNHLHRPGPLVVLDEAILVQQGGGRVGQVQTPLQQLLVRVQGTQRHAVQLQPHMLLEE